MTFMIIKENYQKINHKETNIPQLNDKLMISKKKKKK